MVCRKQTIALIAWLCCSSAQAAPLPKQAGIVYLQIAVGSVANGTYQVITQAIDLNAATVPIQ